MSLGWPPPREDCRARSAVPRADGVHGVRLRDRIRSDPGARRSGRIGGLIGRVAKIEKHFAATGHIANLFEFAPGSARRYSMLVVIGSPSSLYAQSMWFRRPARLYPMRNRHSRKNVFLRRQSNVTLCQVRHSPAVSKAGCNCIGAYCLGGERSESAARQ
jgi:hypothetical protein